MKALRFCLAFVAVLLLYACGGGDAGGGPGQPAATFSFRLQGGGADQEFRYATASPSFIAKARGQLALPVASRKQFPNGGITAGSGGVNLNWNWRFTDMALVDAASEACDATPAQVEADLSYWLDTVKRFCPGNAYVHAEVTGSYTLKQFAIGQTREIDQEDMRVEFVDLTDARCPSAVVCPAPGYAEVLLSVRLRNGNAQALRVTRGKNAQEDQPVLGGLRFTLDSLNPLPETGTLPKGQYRATITIQKP